MSHPLKPIFEPESVAVLGASANPEKRGHQVVAALGASGFAGAVYPINPRGGEILGRRVFTSVDELPETPDLAYIARPAAAVPDAVAACGARGIRGAIVPAVGFGESGSDGAGLESELVAAARETGIRVIGPNTSGLLNTHTGLHMVGGEPLRPGGLAVLAQSGNIALDLMTSASARPIGISIYVGPGNEVDLGFHEILDFLGQHEPTRAIVSYIEGVHDGPALFAAFERVAAKKPVVVLKGGRSALGERTARSHTGAITGSHDVFRALAAESGVIEVERSDELLPVAETLAGQPDLREPAVAVLSDGGGHATLCADYLTDSGVPLAELSDRTKTALAELLGPAASVHNPIDVAGASDQAPEVLTKALEMLASDPACGGVMLTGLFGGYAIRFADGLAPAELEAAEGIADVVSEAGIPLVVHSLYADRSPAPLARLLERGVPVYASLERAARCVAAVYDRSSFLAGAGPENAARGGRRPDSAGAVESAADAHGEERWLSEHEARTRVSSFGVPMVEATLCTNADAAADAARSMASVVLKAVSAHLPHKTEAGAVRVGVEPGDVATVFDEITDSATTYLEARGLPTSLDGVLVSPRLPTPIVELLVGARRDPQFGPVLSIAVGGTAVELHPNVSIVGLPSDAEAIRAACARLAFAPLLDGYRGRPAADKEGLVELALALGTCLVENPELSDIELNPVFVYADRVVAVDALAKVSGEG